MSFSPSKCSPFIRTFSPECQEMLLKIIAKIKPPDENNKWIRVLGKKRPNSSVSKEVPAKVQKNTTEVNMEVTTTETTAQDNDVEFINALDNDILTKYDELVVKCQKTPNLLSAIAEKLSNGAVEKLSTYIYYGNDIDTSFLNLFYEKFLPSYFRRESSWLSLDLLAKYSKKEPSQFKKLLKVILKDTKTPIKLLQDYVQSLHEDDVNIFMNDLLSTDLNKQEFASNLFMIHAIYKACDKRANIQNYILEYILLCGQECQSNRNFGRLLMTYLQTQKDIGLMKDWKKFETVIEYHRSPFQKPCDRIFKEIKERSNDSVSSPVK